MELGLEGCQFATPRCTPFPTLVGTSLGHPTGDFAFEGSSQLSQDGPSLWLTIAKQSFEWLVV